MVDEKKLTQDIADKKFPLVRFVNHPIGIHTIINPYTGKIESSKTFETQFINRNLSDLINDNPESKIYIYHGYGLSEGSFGPYWMKTECFYDPIDFKPVKKTIQCLRAAIIPLTQHELKCQMIALDLPYEQKINKKMLLLIA